VVALLICLGVAAAAGVAYETHRREQLRLENVRWCLGMIRDEIHGLETPEDGEKPVLTKPWPLARGDASDPDGLAALARVFKLHTRVTHVGFWAQLAVGTQQSTEMASKPPIEKGAGALDAWGRKLVYRCPGPVHHQGWDLYSCGPDGIDDHGEGDDILVGADVASIESAK
jgi:hypothetical protein